MSTISPFSCGPASPVADPSCMAALTHVCHDSVSTSGRPSCCTGYLGTTYADGQSANIVAQSSFERSSPVADLSCVEDLRELEACQVLVEELSDLMRGQLEDRHRRSIDEACALGRLEFGEVSDREHTDKQIDMHL